LHVVLQEVVHKRSMQELGVGVCMCVCMRLFHLCAGVSMSENTCTIFFHVCLWIC
jgi:hypothetical protein